MDLINKKRRIFFDMHFPDWENRQTSQNFNPLELAETFSKSNVSSVILYAKCQFGNFYYDTKVGHKHRGLGKTELFTETMNELRKRSIDTIAYYSVAWDEYVSNQRPEYRVVKNANTPKEFRWSTLCINSPYREIIKTHLTELARDIKPDGFWIDMTIIGKDSCFCPHCLEKFYKQSGIKLSGYDVKKMCVEKKGKIYNAYIQFRYDYIEEFYKEIYALIKTFHPTCKVSNNYWGYPYSSSSQGSRAIGALYEADYSTGEAYTDWSGLMAPSFFSRFLRSAKSPFEALVGRFSDTWDYTCKPAVQLAAECYTVVSNGGCATIDDEPYANGAVDKELYNDIEKIFDNIKSREKYLTGEHIKYAAVWHSQATKDYALSNIENFIKNISGSYRLMRDNRMPIEFIFDENVSYEKIIEYKVIIMPSVSVIKKEHFDMIKKYVENGGMVIASGEFGLYDIKDYELIKTEYINELGIKFDGISEYSLSYWEMENIDYKKNITRPSLVRGNYIKYSAYENEVLGYVIDPICETTETTFFHNNIPAPYEKTEYPSLILIKKGSGQIFLFSQNIFSQYAKYHQLEIRHIIKNIFSKLQKTHIISYKNLPLNVEITEARSENEIVINLINYNPGLSVCAGLMEFNGVYSRTVDYMEDYIPIYNIEAEIKNVCIKRIRALDLKENIDFIAEKNITRFNLRKLDLWETIVIYLK